MFLLKKNFFLQLNHLSAFFAFSKDNSFYLCHNDFLNICHYHYSSSLTLLYKTGNIILFRNDASMLFGFSSTFYPVDIPEFPFSQQFFGFSPSTTSLSYLWVSPTLSSMDTWISRLILHRKFHSIFNPISNYLESSLKTS